MASEGKLSDDQIRQLDGLAGREPDTMDIPEASDANWLLARRGALSKVRKQAISLRLDMDLLDWLRRQGPGYQTTINRILREKMESDQPAG